MTTPLCPLCGATLETNRGFGSSAPSLSCTKCDWESGYSHIGESLNRGGADPAFLKQLPSGEEAQYIFTDLLHIPTPRRLGWNWHIKLAVAVLPLAACLSIWTLVEFSGKGNYRDSVPVLIFVWIAALISYPLLPELSNRRILREGQLTVGRVVVQESLSGGKRTWSVIFYAFADGASRGFVGNGTDFSDSLAQGAPIIVYYDPVDPDKNVATECSRFKVKTPK